jgi:Protein of unknown function (DUF3565)
MQRKIIGFHQDDQHDWVADLECGHTQHVRHDPPWTNRPWVLSPEGRRSRIGYPLDCKRCDGVQPDGCGPFPSCPEDTRHNA